MGDKGLKLKILLISLLALSVSHCARDNHSNQDNPDVVEGTRHSGGGETAQSKPEEVAKNLDLAIRLASEANEQKNIFVQFWKSTSRSGAGAEKITPLRIFPNLNSSAQSGQFSSPALETFSRNKIERLVSGDCPRTLGAKHADASVSELTTNAAICFSIGNLTSIPPSVLLREILSLVLHEAAHMGGADELEAIAWQTNFSKYFGERFGDITTDNVTVQTYRFLNEARLALGQAIERVARDQSNVRAYTFIGRAKEKLVSLPHFDDPLALELMTQAKRPELINNYSLSVLALIERIQKEFERQPTLDIRTPLPVHIPIDIRPTRVAATLTEMQKDLDRILENFIAFTEGGSEVRSTCKSPLSDVNIPSRPNSVFSQRTYGPDKNCTSEVTL